MRATVFAIGGAWTALAALRGLARRACARCSARAGRSRPTPPPRSASVGRRRRPAASPTSAPAASADGTLETLAAVPRRARPTEYRDARLAAAEDRAPARGRVRLAVRRLRRRHPHERPARSPRINLARGPARLQPRLQRGRPDDVQPAHEGRPTRCASPRFEIVPTLTPRQLFERLELAIAASAPEVSRACVATASPPCAVARARSLGARASRGRHAPRRRRSRCRARAPTGTPIVLALTATHPDLRRARARSRRTSRRSGCSRPRGSRSQPGGRFAYNAADAFTTGLAARGARLVPVLADPEHLAGEPARRRPAAAAPRAAPRASRCARSARAASCSTGAICRRRRARRTRPSLHELRVELGARARRSSSPCRRCARMRALRTGAYDLRALARPARLLVLRLEPSTARAASPARSPRSRSGSRRCAPCCAPRRARASSWACRPGAGSWSAGGAAPSRRTQAELFPKATQTALQRPYGARVGERRVGRVRPLGAAQAADRAPGAASRGVALWVRGGESSATWTSAAAWRRAWTAARPRGSTARPRTPRADRCRGARRAARACRRRRSSSTTAPPTRPPATTRRARRSRERPRHETLR